NAVAYGTPLIITTLFHQTPLITIVSSLIINLGFGTIGGLLGMSIVNRFGTPAHPVRFRDPGAVAGAAGDRRHPERGPRPRLRGHALGLRLRPGRRSGCEPHELRDTVLSDEAARNRHRVQSVRAPGLLDRLAHHVPDPRGLLGHGRVL